MVYANYLSVILLIIKYLYQNLPEYCSLLLQFNNVIAKVNRTISFFMSVDYICFFSKVHLFFKFTFIFLLSLFPDNYITKIRE